jgi:DNA-binding CsgD family transcriptional regulator
MQRPPPVAGAGVTPAPGALPRLSERERQMLGHLAAGRSIRQIAAAMSISTNTVRGHGHSLLAKFGVGQRHEVVRRAVELEML